MVEGVWVGPGQHPPAKPRAFSSAILPARTTDLASDASFRCLDLVQIALADNPYDWTWGVLSEAGIYTWGHTIGLNLGEPWRFVTWALGQPRIYSVAYAPALSPGEIAREYGPVVGDAARPDYPAVQLALTLAP
jgi:hypothetical protein